MIEGGKQLVVLLGEQHWAELAALEEELHLEALAAGRSVVVSHGDAVRRAIEKSAEGRVSGETQRTHPL